MGSAEKYIESRNEYRDLLEESEQATHIFRNDANWTRPDALLAQPFHNGRSHHPGHLPRPRPPPGSAGQPLVELFPDVDSVGVLADEFDNESSNSEDEGIEDYVKGGYHPVFRGEVLNGRYVILQKLGWGHFSTVWLSRDIKFNTYVAIKIQKSESRYLEAAFDEVEILQKAVKQAHNPEWLADLRQIYRDENRKFESDDCHVVQLLNAFIYQGPYGRHFCMVFEILGVNLLEIIKRYDYKGIPLPLCKEIGKQVLIGLHYLHKYCGIIHTDLKPENVMVCLNADELKEIVESGQLNNNKKIERRLNLIKNKIRGLKGEPPLPPPANEQTIEEPFAKGGQELKAEQSESERESLNGGTVSRGIRITNEEELNREFEQLCSIRNITNKNEKKNLKKRLKKKLKQFNKESLKGYKGSIRNAMAVPPVEERKAAARVRVSENPLFARSGLTDNFRIKIADLGNGCWTHHHFQPEIQTRQYRSPETILGINYNETCDIWSFACMLFEMLTGEFLFDPRKNQLYSKSTDHLKLMMEMLNRFPKDYSTVGTQSKKFVDYAGNFKKVAELNFKTMRDVLVRRYKADPAQAAALQDFLTPMLDIYPQTRTSAFRSLFHSWLEAREGEQFFRAPGEEEPEAADFEPVLDLPEEFKRVVDQDEFDADKSYVSNATDDVETKDDMEYQTHPYEREIKYFDRNFKNVYVGYADGIDLNHLDNTANWQFESKHH